MVTYSIRFVVDYDKHLYPRYTEIALDSSTDEDAKKKFVEFCKQNPNRYNYFPYILKPALIRLEILAVS